MGGGGEGEGNVNKICYGFPLGLVHKCELSFYYFVLLWHDCG